MSSGRARATCLVKPPPELYAATSELLLIAKLLEAGDMSAAREVLLSFELEACRLHWTRCGSEGLRRHDKSRHVGRRRRKRVAVTPTMRIQVGERDGWRCRYCELPIVWDGFFKGLDEVRLPNVGDLINDLWRVFGHSLDHVLPVAAGGHNVPANIVSACSACNYSKADCLLDELDLDDPCAREPIRDAWTGLIGRPHAGTPGLV